MPGLFVSPISRVCEFLFILYIRIYKLIHLVLVDRILH